MQYSVITYFPDRFGAATLAMPKTPSNEPGMPNGIETRRGTGTRTGQVRRPVQAWKGEQGRSSSSRQGLFAATSRRRIADKVWLPIGESVFQASGKPARDFNIWGLSANALG